MKEIKIKTVLINSENETTNCETNAKYNKDNETYIYKEDDLTVTLKIKKNHIIINRKNDDYDLNLEFKENEKIVCNYKILSLGLNLDLLVTTLKLEIKEKYIYIQYKLNNKELDMGTFEYKILFINKEEQ
ncbi:MAG: DUF1934 domain-containing protein [Tenericutes bacterium]|nr:DUF1934 family protein [Bacilli bacterium]MDD3995305.1 DUF1934 family protein [Bacilli bacterium]MDD4624643.1 DUF1934 family protein [Bacilli bacterium]MDD4831480.1 DUF1934 family protein [Bacilli bacterium]NLV89910.1 DUF1934 domain-containing protein [Mycoplasmatota bacterium]